MFLKRIDKSIVLKDNKFFRFLESKSIFLLIAISVLIFIGTFNIANTQKFFILPAIILMLLFVIYNKVIKIDLRFILILAFGFFYTLGCTIFNGINLSYLFYPPSLAIIFQFCLTLIRTKNTRFLNIVLFSYSCGFFANYSSIIVASIGNQGIFYDGGFVSDFWHNDIDSFMLRTGLSLYCLGMTSYSIACLYKNQYRTITNIIISALTICFCFITSILSSNRSLPIIFIAFFLFLGFNSITKIHNRTLKTILFVSICGLVVFGFLILLGFVKLPFNLTFLERILDPTKNSNSARMELYTIFFKNFYKYPIGGLNTLQDLDYVHNVFLDMYTYGGFIPFVIFVAFSIDMTIKLLKAKDKTQMSEGRYMLYLSMFVLTIGLGLFEPIYNANQNILSPLLVIYIALCYGAYSDKKEISKIDYYTISI